MDTALVMNSIFLAYKELGFCSMFTFVINLQNILKDLYKSMKDDVFHYNYPTKLGLHLVTWCRTWSRPAVTLRDSKVITWVHNAPQHLQESWDWCMLKWIFGEFREITYRSWHTDCTSMYNFSFTGQLQCFFYKSLYVQNFTAPHALSKTDRNYR